MSISIEEKEHNIRLSIRSFVGKRASELFGVYTTLLTISKFVGKDSIDQSAWYLLPVILSTIIIAGTLSRIENNRS